jgi:hypothetical protein
MTINVGDTVLVPAPTCSDLWQHEFQARVDELPDNGYVRVVDQDGDHWDVEPERLTVL